ncbi:MAG TPA: aminoglycoside phosphotransferase family protein [Gaiellaceae bacterium]
MRSRPGCPLPRRDRAGAAGLGQGRALNLPWKLELGEPFVAPYSRLVAPVRLEDGTEAVLKIPRDDDVESVHEPEALAFWGGEGAVRLIDRDPGSRAYLIERCVPGTPLGTEYDDASIGIAATAMQRLWREPPTSVEWRTVETEAARWLHELPQRYRPGRLLDEALDAIRRLVPTQERLVLCHQDLHGGNVLRAEREPWLAIDSKPIVAEPAYDTVALVRDADPTVGELRRRLDQLSELLGLDRERMRLWGIVKSLAWDNPDEAELYSQVRSRR